MSRVGKLSLIAAVALTGTAALVPVEQAHAQQIYRSVGPDGKVTFSDQPPANNAKNTSVKSRESASPEPASDGGALPYALQQVVNRYPVTIYTGSDCAPCDAARNLLVSRGVPFTERTVSNNESIDALKALNNGNSNIPFATVGGQHLNGFSDTAWIQYLDAAGYPKKSQLPPSYRRPTPTPIATAKDAQAPQQPSAQARPAARPAPAESDQTAPSGPTPTNPTGLVF